MVPMHGEFRMQVAHGRLAVEAGVDPSRVHIAENGFPIEFHPDGSVRRPKPVAHGRRLIVHGSSHPLDESLLTERLRLAAEGIVVVAIGSNGASPVVLSRGFLDAEQERRLLPGAAAAAAQVLKEPGLSAERRAERVAAVVAGYLARETGRRPQVMPLTVA
jgi:ribonuclease J